MTPRNHMGRRIITAQPTQFPGVYATTDASGKLRIVDDQASPGAVRALDAAFTADCACGGHAEPAPAPKAQTHDISPKQIAENFKAASRTLAAGKPAPVSGVGGNNLVSTDSEAARKGRAAAERVNAGLAAHPLRDFNATARAAWKGQR